MTTNTDYRNEKTYKEVKWFLDKYNDPKKREKLLSKYTYLDEYDYGMICKATAVGKTTDIYLIAIKTIEAFKAGKLDSEKLAIDLASHRLLLSEQSTKKLVVILLDLGLIDEDNTCLVVNSSDDLSKWDNLFENTELDVKTRDEIKNTKYSIYLITSCFKSETKLNEVFTSVPLIDAYKVSVLDEAHEMSLLGLQSTATNPNLCIDVNTHLAHYNKCYGLSATPEEKLTYKLREAENRRRRLLNLPEMDKDKLYIEHISPERAINEKMILPPEPYIIKGCVKTAATYADMIESALKASRKRNKAKKLINKILATLPGIDMLKQVRNILLARGYNVFSTNSEESFMNGNQELSDASIDDFKNQILDCQEDCIVLHIRQLTAGIDISGLTAVIMFELASARTVAQTVGRTLRYYNQTERALAEEHPNELVELTKTCGEVYFVSDSDDKTKEFSKQLYQIYGFNYINYSEDNGTTFKTVNVSVILPNIQTFTYNPDSCEYEVEKLESSLEGFCKTLSEYVNSVGFNSVTLNQFRHKLGEKIFTTVHLFDSTGSDEDTNFFADQNSPRVRALKEDIKKLYPELKNIIG